MSEESTSKKEEQQSPEDASITEAMNNFKDLISTLDGNTTKASDSFAAAFEKTFDKSLVAMTKPLHFHESSDVTEMSYDELYETCEKYFEAGIKAEVVDMKRNLKDGIEYTVYTTDKDAKVAVLFQSIAFIKEGKIVRIERQKTEDKKVPTTVNGQVAASAEAPLSEGLPEDTMLAKTVLSLPEQVQGKYLTTGNPEIVPAKNAGQLIKLLLDHRRRGFLGRKGDATIRDMNYHPYAGGAHLKEYHRPINVGVFVLQDKDDKPIALCVQDRKKLNKAYYICGTEPLRKGDEAKEKEAGIDFYHWFHVYVGDDDDKRSRYIEAWNGTTFEPMWRATPVMKRANEYSDDMAFVPGQFIIATESSEEQVGYIVRTKGGGQNAEWKLTIAPGVDPALMLCIAPLLGV